VGGGQVLFLDRMNRIDRMSCGAGG
jgi:hypothetical protein